MAQLPMVVYGAITARKLCCKRGIILLFETFMGCQYLLPPGVLYHSLGERHGLNNCDSCQIYYFLEVQRLKLDLVVKI